MINKKIIISFLLLSFFLILSLNGILAYTLKFPLCSPPIINNSCINYTIAQAVTNAPSAIMYFGQDGNLYLTNDTLIQYTVINNITYPTYQTINTTNITYIYNYNATNGSVINVTIYQNITANETYLRQWLASINFSNASSNISSLFNISGYNRAEAEAAFAFKSELTNLQNGVSNTFATKVEMNNLDAKYAALLIGQNGTVTNFTALAEKIENNTSGEFSITWEIIIIINSILAVCIILFLVRSMMSGD